MAGGPASLARLPGGDYLLALGVGARRLVAYEWTESILHRWMLTSPRPRGLAIGGHELRPADPVAGHKILSGTFDMGGAVLETGARGDPWDRPSPSKRFALALHRLDWMRDLLAVGPDANAEGLRLVLDWSRVFGRWNAFSWSPSVLGRRVFNLACCIRAISPGAADAERALIAVDLARQARHLLATLQRPQGLAEGAIAVALAGAALSEEVGRKLMDKGLARLVRALPLTVLPDGGHASRNPRAALELLFDLRVLDAALEQHGLHPPEDVLRAVDRLAAAVRFFTLADGSLPDLQGSDAVPPAYVAAALGGEAGGPTPAGRNGFQRLDGRGLQVVADAAPATEDGWSLAACAQPLAIEVLAHGRRLVTSCGAPPADGGFPGLRQVDAASTLVLGEATCGGPATGLRATAMGPRLLGAPQGVDFRRQEAEGGLWLEMSHDGWERRFHLRHDRRLFVSQLAEELRGEDRLTPVGDSAAAEAGRRFIPFVIRFHLHPDVASSLARDGKSVLLRPPGDEVGWRLRSDAREMAIEESAYFQAGVPRRATQVVLRGQARADAGATVRWKLAVAEELPPH